MIPNPDDNDRSRPRQAVILIHGIGEQRPMATLRGFVNAFLDQGTYHSKPDTISSSYELRRIKLRRVVGDGGQTAVNADWPDTDFYEYYWAHQMYGTRIAHVASWFFRTMKRGVQAAWKGDLSKPSYHPRLRWMLPLAGLVAMAAAGIALAVATRYPARVAFTGLTALVVGTLWKICIAPLMNSAVIDVVGDAARYLDVAPQNVARRYDIIRGGIEMLRHLHSTGDTDNGAGKVTFDYSRVVVIGHSLGSLIAYDVVRHYWAEVNGRIAVAPVDFEDVERFDGGNDIQEGVPFDTHKDAKKFRSDQGQCWRKVNRWWFGRRQIPQEEAQRPGGARWLVTDLVTLGSPLTYAPLLMADGLCDLEEKKRLREVLTCPPDRSRHVNRGRFTVALSQEADRFQNYPILAHHAVFAITRWTNFYFRNDPVGGPLGTVFLNGIEDRVLETGSLRGRPLSAHVSYWKNRDGKLAEPAKPCVEELRQILTRFRIEEETNVSIGRIAGA